MKPSPFGYHRPATVDEAVSLLAELEDAKVLAGGQSLIPLMNFRLAAPAHLVDISGIDELASVTVDDGVVRVGAAVTHARLLDDAVAGAACPLLPQALELVAHQVIRNRGTVCGSLAHADPAGELTAVLSVLGGSVSAAGSSGTRLVSAHDLFVGMLETSLGEDELVIAAEFPALAPNTGTAFVEVARRHGDYAMCGAAAVVTIDDGAISRARLGFIAVASTPVVMSLDEVVAGRAVTDVDRSNLYDFVSGAVDPPADLHATAEYRRHLAGVLAGDAMGAAARALEGAVP